MRSKGLTPAQIAGVIGSMQGESGKGLDPNATNPNGGAYGIAQWLGGRKTALLNRPNPSSLSTQLNHLWSELQGPERGALQALKGAHTPEDAAIAWQRAFERGAPFEQKYGQRAANARSVFNSLGQTVAGQPSPGGTPAATQTTPGVDNSGLRAQAVQQFLGSKNADPVSFAMAIRNAQDVPGQTTSTPAATPARAAGTPSGNFGKSHSSLLELIHKTGTGQGFAVKNGQEVSGPNVYGAVWAGHQDHVHAAAGPKTIVELGHLAQSMGLHVGENPHFGGVHPVHAKNSYHYKGEAIDVSGDPKKMNAFARKVEQLYGLRPQQ